MIEQPILIVCGNIWLGLNIFPYLIEVLPLYINGKIPSHLKNLPRIVASGFSAVFCRGGSLPYLCFTLFFFAVCMAPVSVLAERSGVSPLIRELDVLLEKGEKSKLAPAPFLQDLKNIIKKYRPVVRQKLLLDTFSDGDFTHNPTWKVVRGKFRIDGNGSLFSAVGGLDDTLQMQKGGVVPEANAKRKQMGQILELMQALSNEGRSVTPKKATKRYVISSLVPTPNSFDLSLNFRSGRSKGHAEVGLFVNHEQKTGYRLLLFSDPASNQSLSLVRYEEGRSHILRWAGGLFLGNGLSHHIRWQRLDSGQMKVWIDGVEMLRVRDSGLWNGFSGLLLANEKGEFAFDNISLQAIK